MAVAQEEIGGVHQNASIGLRRHSEAPQNGLRERVFDRLALRGVGAGRAEVLVALHHHHARSDALEADDLALALLSAVQADIVGAQSGGEPGGIEEPAYPSAGSPDRDCRCALPNRPGRSHRFSACRWCALRCWGYAPAAVPARGAATPALLGVQRVMTTECGEKSEHRARQPQGTIIGEVTPSRPSQSRDRKGAFANFNPPGATLRPLLHGRGSD